jgi:hypothetical protein
MSGRKGFISNRGPNKPKNDKKVPPKSKRDSDKDEVEKDDLKNDGVVELRTVQGTRYWMSLTGSNVYRYRSGTSQPLPAKHSRSDRAKYQADRIGVHRKGRIYLITEDESD